MTERIVRAIEHPLVDVIGHPSGRKIEQRRPYEFDLERVIEAAAATGTMLEINSSPDRRDLNETSARAAAAAGVPIVINCDAHRVKGFAVARYGIATARRGWLTARDVANTQAVGRGRRDAPAQPVATRGVLRATALRPIRARSLGPHGRSRLALGLRSPGLRPRSPQPRWIATNHVSPARHPISAIQKFRRIPRMCTE